MAELRLPLSRIAEAARAQMELRAKLALQIYRRVPLRKDAPDYPFASRPEDGDIREERSSKVTRLANGVRITVRARGAKFLEYGNDAGGRFIKARPGKSLAIPLRTTVDFSGDGQPVLRTGRVRSYRGRNQLERSVRRAFTGRSGLRGGPS